MAKVAFKTAVGLELPISDFLNELKLGLGAELADYVLDEEALSSVLVEGMDGEGVRHLVDRSYEDLKDFMEKHDRAGEYVDFRAEMQLVDDGKGGQVWVSNANVDQWKASHPC